MPKKQESWDSLKARSAGARRRARLAVSSIDHLRKKPKWWQNATLRGLRLGKRGWELGRGLARVVVPEEAILRVECVDPWPRVQLDWYESGTVFRARVATDRPRRGAVSAGACEASFEMEASAEEAIRRLESYESVEIAPGWSAVEHIDWQTTDEWPDDERTGPRERGYRLAPEEPVQVIARRTPPPVMEALLGWMASRFRPVRRVREAILTEAWLFVRDYRGDTVRMPIESLRWHDVSEDGDEVFVFARRTRLVLPRRDGCPLADALAQRC